MGTSLKEVPGPRLSIRDRARILAPVENGRADPQKQAGAGARYHEKIKLAKGQQSDRAQVRLVFQ